MNLCIDWGNSSVKAAVFNDDQIVERFHFSETEAVAALASVIDTHKPVKAILCSVTNHPGEAEQVIKEKIKSFIKMDGNTRTPIVNAYLSSDTLGADRLALVTAAHLLNPDKNNLVISLGTCITYNFIQANRTFRGGAISPGLHMRLKAMHDYTGKLPEVAVDGDLRLIGYDTDTCLRSGAIFGMAAEIDGMIAEFKTQYPDFNAVLTGGDAPLFVTKIKSKIFADSDLLLKGLNLILKYNVPIPR
jgi:type III pantothenate kinase